MADRTQIVRVSTFLAGLFTRNCTSTFPLCWLDEKRQMAFSCVCVDFIFQCYIQKWLNFTVSPSCMTPSYCHWAIPHFLRLLMGQYAPTLRGYIATSGFGVHLTLPDSLRTRWHVDKTILKEIGMYKDFFLVTGDCEDKMWDFSS